MVMGPTHAMSGAAVGLVAAQLIPAAWGGPTSIPEMFVWGGVCAGAALLPDVDLPQSTVSRAFGPASQAVSRGLHAVSAFFYHRTKNERDNHRDPGHRTLTHTLLFAVGLGLVVSGFVSVAGKFAVMVTLFPMLGLALRGLAGSWAKRSGTLTVTAATALLTVVAALAMPAHAGAGLGLMLTIGCITHCLGDGITKEGIPFLAPMEINGKRWWEFTLPRLLRIRANGTFEKVALLPAFTAITVIAAFTTLPPVNAALIAVVA